jgi:lysophospholipid acyltransferase (LPLAT)-like uncharacterized protein
VRFLLTRLVFLIYRLVSLTWRIKIIESSRFQEIRKNNSPLILAHWHGDEIALLCLVARYKVATMSSLSKDGESMSYFIHQLGGVTSRGSSSRGAVSALKGLIRLGKSGHVMSVAVDGPRGPRHIPKQGVFELSRMCNAHIAALGTVSSQKYISEKSWNKIYLPLPFAQVFIWLDIAMNPLTREDDPKSTLLRNQLKIDLDAAHQAAGKIIAENDAGC